MTSAPKYTLYPREMTLTSVLHLNVTSFGRCCKNLDPSVDTDCEDDVDNKRFIKKMAVNCIRKLLIYNGRGKSQSKK